MPLTHQLLLRDPDVQVTDDVIAEILKTTGQAYRQFVDELTHHDIHLEWRYYPDGKAWLAKAVTSWKGVRGGQKQRTIFWLSIWDGYFKISIYVPVTLREDLARIMDDPIVKTMILTSEPLGKLKFFPLVFEVSTNEGFVALFSVLDFMRNVKSKGK